MNAGRPLPVLVAALVLVAGLLAPVPTAAQSQNQMTWAVHVSVAPTWFDPAEHTGIITIMKVLYALHDAMVKPMPGNAMAPSLAESWSMAKDGLSYEFVLRKGVVFHNGDPLTAEDVKFSFERYRGAAAKLLKDQVSAVEIVDSHRVRFRLKEPWPDFLTFYAPRHRRGMDRAEEIPRKGRRRGLQEGADRGRAVQARVVQPRHRVGLRRPRPLLAQDACRQAHGVEGRARGRDAARHAQARRGRRRLFAAWPPRRGGEAHGGTQARPHRHLRHAVARLRAPAMGSEIALARPARAPRRRARLRQERHQQAETLGHSKPTGSIIPSAFEYALAIPAYPYDPVQARKLLAEAGYPNGFDAGDYACDSSYSSVAESIGTYLGAVGIRTKMRPMERAAYLTQWKDKKIRGLMQTGAGGHGNAATRVQNYIVTDGLYALGGYPDIDDLYVQQAREADPKRREMLLHQIQRLAHERVTAAPLWELGFINAVGPRVEESGIGLIVYHPYSAPYEDLKLKK
jgi:peptide/nickel transport system substrate-binding protein